MTMSRCKGTVIFFVLIFLQIFSIIGLHVLTQERIKMRALVHDWQRTMAKQAAWETIGGIEDQWVSESLSCLVSPISAITLKKKPLSWWQANACGDKVNAFEYYYVVEKLEKDECSIVLVNDIGLAVVYYRITLLALPFALKNGKIMLQTIVVKSTDDISLCTGKARMVRLGRQIQREI